MLNKPEFEFFRYCDGNWKIMRWATKAYASWAHNYVKSNDASDNKTFCVNKQKHNLLDNPSFHQFDDDELKDSPVENNSNALASPALSDSASVTIQVYSNQLLEMLY